MPSFWLLLLPPPLLESALVCFDDEEDEEEEEEDDDDDSFDDSFDDLCSPPLRRLRSRSLSLLRLLPCSLRVVRSRLRLPR